MKIAVVTPELPAREYPNRGRSVLATLTHLRGYAEMEIFCPLPRYPESIRPKFDYRRTDVSYSLPGFSSRYFEYPAVPGITRPVNGFTCAHYLEPHLRRASADVILNFWLYPAGFAALQVGRKLGLPVVVGSMGSDLNAIPDPLSTWLTKKTVKGAAQVITKSVQLRERAISLGAAPERVHVIVNGCDSSVFFVRDREAARKELGVALDAELVVFAGRMHSAKGVRELLEAVTRLCAQRRRLRLVYVGDGPELIPLRERASTSALDNRVRFAGPCCSPQVATWLAASNLMALPSYAEGCPNIVIEALSSGRPVVATTVGSISELVDHSSGRLVPPRDVTSLTSALQAALDVTWDEHAISRRFLRTWDEVAKEVFAVCEKSLTDVSEQ